MLFSRRLASERTTSCPDPTWPAAATASGPRGSPASGCPFPADDYLVGWARDSVLQVFPEYRTSLKTDFDAGRPIESQTQFMDVYELGRSLGLEMPAYGKVVRKCGYDV